MAKASLTIAISGTYNGRALESARKDLEKLKLNAISEMGGAGSALANFGSKAAEVGGQIHNMGYHMQQVGSKATRYLTVPLVGAAAAIGKAAVDIDTSLTNVKKTVDGTEEQYDQLKDAAIEFSKTNAVSAKQILDIQSLGAQLGFSIDELDEFSRVTAGLDIATNMDAETAATQMAQFANITKMAHGDVSNYGSTIVELGNNMATTEKDISNMSMRIAAAGTQVGMSQADILGLSAALSSMGIEAEAGGTAISTIISQIDKDIATGSDSVEVWASTAGMSAQQFADAWRKDPVEALTALLSNMESATAEGGNMSVMLEELGIDSIRQTDVMKRLAGNSDLVTKAIKLANDGWKDNTALQKEVDNRNASLSARFEILKNRVIAVAEKVGKPLVDALLDVVDAAEPLLESVGKAAQAFADMDEKDQKMILGLAGAAAAFGPVTSLLGKLTSGVGNMIVNVGKGAQKIAMFKSEMALLNGVTKASYGPTLSFGQAVKTLGGTQLPMVTKALGMVKAAAIGIGIGAAIALVGALVSVVGEFLEHQRKVEAATYDLEHAMDSAADAYDAYSDGAQGAVKSMSDLRAQTDECIEKQGELAKSMSDQWSDYGTNAAMVDAYAKQIQQLTTKTDEYGNRVQLTEDEQAKLKLAVDGFNSATGTSIQITDALNGTLDTSTDIILANAEAFKEQAKAQAAQEMYKDVYKQQIENEMALADATARLNDLKAKEADAWQYTTNGVNPYSYQVAEAQRQVDELTRAQESNAKTQEQLLDVVTGSTDGFKTFDEALANTGINLSDFGNISETELQALRDGFDGSLTSIVKTCNEQGLKVPETLASAINERAGEAKDAGTSLGQDVNAGIAQGIDQNAGLTAEAIRSVCGGITATVREIMQIHSPSVVMAELGKEMDAGIAQGIGTGNQSTSAMENLGAFVLKAAMDNYPGMSEAGKGVAKWFANGIGSFSAYPAAQDLAVGARNGLGSIDTFNTGHNFAVGFANGMGNVNIWGAAYNIGVSALGAIKSALGIASPSKEAAKVGEWFGQGAVEGMRSTEGAIAGEASRMSDLMRLTPNGTSLQAGSFGSGSVNMNVTVNVTANSPEEGKAIGASIVDTIYEEISRRMGARLWDASYSTL